MTTDNMQAAIDALHVRIDNLAERLETSLSPNYSPSHIQIMWQSLARLDDQVQHNAQVRSKRMAELDARIDALAERLETLLAQPLPSETPMIDPTAKSPSCSYANLACAYRERLERIEKNLWPTVAAVAAETSQPADSLATAIRLIMRCVPVLDLQISEHNDCHRLRRAISDYLADAGYPGWLSSRGLIADR